jgi:hypothetical protein
MGQSGGSNKMGNTIKNTSKLWRLGTGIEFIGVLLFIVIIVPTVFTWVSAEVEDAAEEEVYAHEQRVLIEELSEKVEALQIQQIAK